jgi:hypothetical protein
MKSMKLTLDRLKVKNQCPPESKTEIKHSQELKLQLRVDEAQEMDRTVKQ